MISPELHYDVKTFHEKMESVSGYCLWKSGQTTFIPLWDRMEGSWLWTLYYFISPRNPDLPPPSRPPIPISFSLFLPLLPPGRQVLPHATSTGFIDWQTADPYNGSCHRHLGSHIRICRHSAITPLSLSHYRPYRAMAAGGLTTKQT